MRRRTVRRVRRGGKQSPEAAPGSSCSPRKTAHFCSRLLTGPAAEPPESSAFLGVSGRRSPAGETRGPAHETGCGEQLPALGYVLALELLRSAFPFPVAAACLEQLRQWEPDPGTLRAAAEQLERLGFLASGELTAEGKRAAWAALRSVP